MTVSDACGQSRAAARRLMPQPVGLLGGRSCRYVFTGRSGSGRAEAPESGRCDAMPCGRLHASYCPSTTTAWLPAKDALRSAIGGVSGQAAQQKADIHPRMEARPAAPSRGAKLPAPGGTGPGQQRSPSMVVFATAKGRYAAARQIEVLNPGFLYPMKKAPASLGSSSGSSRKAGKQTWQSTGRCRRTPRIGTRRFCARGVRPRLPCREGGRDRA